MSETTNQTYYSEDEIHEFSHWLDSLINRESHSTLHEQKGLTRQNDGTTSPKSNKKSRTTYTIQQDIGEIARTAINISKRPFILHDVIPCRNVGQADAILQELRIRQGHRGSGWSFIYVHDDDDHSWTHIHVVHDCSYVQQNCRCQLLNGIPNRIRRTKSTGAIGNATEQYITNLILYFYKKSIGTLYVQLGSEGSTAIPIQDLIIRTEQNSGDISEGLVEVRDSGDENDYRGSSPNIICDTSVEPSDAICPPRSRRNSETIPSTSNSFPNTGVNATGLDAGKKGRAYILATEVIIQHLCAPLTSIKSKNCWVESWGATALPRTVDQAFSIAATIIANMTVSELYQLLTKCHPKFKVKEVLFGAPSIEKFFDYYYTESETVSIVTNLLEFQFKDSDSIVDFWNTLYRVLDKCNGKKNTIQIIGPPNSFKTTFVTWIAEAMINVGYANKINRYSVFGWQDLANKRIGIMDDYNLDDAAKIDALTIFAGHKTNIQVKYQGEHILHGLPMFVLSNHYDFKGPAWNERIVRYTWSRYDFVMEKNLNPLSVFYFLNKDDYTY